METSSAERWLAAIVDSSDDAIIGESLDGIVTSWNRGAERIFGYSAQEAVGRAIESLIWPDLDGGEAELLQKVVRGERVEHFETVRRDKAGRRVLVSISMSPIRDKEGDVIGVAKIARDTTKHVAMQESLLASSHKVRILTEQEAQSRATGIANARFRELIENAPDGIIQVDTTGKIVLCNRSAEKMLGYTHPELIGLEVDQLVPEARRAGHSGHRSKFAAAGVARPMGMGLELRARRKDGSEFPVEISLSPVTSAEGVQVIAVIRDVTERKRVEEQVRTLQESYMAELEIRQKEAERLNQIKSEFLASISHELRTPLHTIIGFSDLLREELEGPLNETQREFVRHIHRDSEHLLGLINDVLDLSRMETGGFRVKPESLALRDVIYETADSIRPHAQAMAIRMRTDDPGDLRVLADPIRLRQILYNLLSNAVKFTPSGGSVTVSARPTGRAVQVTVADTGIGMSQQEQARIFDRFYQVSGEHGGVGLGLAICRQLLDLQNGSLSVDSEPGRGSQFHFVLPMDSQ